MYAEPGWARVAGLAPSVVACAQSGDTVALQILKDGVVDLVASVQAVVQRLHMTQPFKLVLAGNPVPIHLCNRISLSAVCQLLTRRRCYAPAVEVRDVVA